MRLSQGFQVRSYLFHNALSDITLLASALGSTHLRGWYLGTGGCDFALRLLHSIFSTHSMKSRSVLVFPTPFVIQSQDKILHFAGNEARALLYFYNQCDLIYLLPPDTVEGLKQKGDLTGSPVS
jgi:hypothetical protein